MKNNIRYKGNTNNTSVIIFLKSKVKNSQRWYFAWENRRGGFCDVNLISFLIIILLLFFICRCSSFVNVLHSHFLFGVIPHPSVIAGFLHRFYNFGLAHCSVIRETFTFSTIPLPLHSCRGRYGLEWALLNPQAFFT